MNSICFAAVVLYINCIDFVSVAEATKIWWYWRYILLFFTRSEIFQWKTCIVAIVCHIFVVDLPALLLLEPFLRSKFNFVRIKPLLDQFQGSYKDKYCWFTAYYLICRLVIFLIILSLTIVTGSIECTIIALNYVWMQPYKYEFIYTY